MTKTTDIRVIKTQNALLTALESLLKNKKLSCISVTELCSAASINRNTFYYHYNNIYELIDDNKKALAAELGEVMDVSQTRDSSTIIEICKVLKRHPSLLNILISPNCELNYFDDIFGIASEKARIFLDKKKALTSTRELMACSFCNAGLQAVLREWITNGMVEDPEEIADIIKLSSRKGPISIMFPDEQ